MALAVPIGAANNAGFSPEAQRLPPLEQAALDVALLLPIVEVNDVEGRPLAFVTWLDSHDVLVILSSDLQLGDRAGAVVALQFFAAFGVLVIAMHFNVAPVLLRVTLDHLAVLPQLVAIKGDDL